MSSKQLILYQKIQLIEELLINQDLQMFYIKIKELKEKIEGSLLEFQKQLFSILITEEITNYIYIKARQKKEDDKRLKELIREFKQLKSLLKEIIEGLKNLQRENKSNSRSLFLSKLSNKLTELNKRHTSLLQKTNKIRIQSMQRFNKLIQDLNYIHQSELLCYDHKKITKQLMNKLKSLFSNDEDIMRINISELKNLKVLFMGLHEPYSCNIPKCQVFRKIFINAEKLSIEEIRIFLNELNQDILNSTSLRVKFYFKNED